MNDLVDRLDHPITGLTRELFDLPPFSLAEHLLPAIAKCVGVRIWITTRREENISGEIESHRFFAVFGCQQDVDTTSWLFDRIEDTLGQQTAEYVNEHIFSLTDKRILEFQRQQLIEIREQLTQIIDYSRAEKDALIEPAFASLNIKIVRKKKDHVRPQNPVQTYASSIAIT
jgi:hypothetical protein